MADWNGLTFHRLVSVPRRPRDPQEVDPTPAQLLAALTAGYAALSEEHGAPLIAVGWLRPAGEQRIGVHVGGRPRFTSVTDGPPGESVAVLYPPGARGVPVDPAEVERAAGSLPYWVACPGRFDRLSLPDADDRREPLRRSFDDYVAHLQGGFGWFVFAEPLAPGAVDRELAALEGRITQLRRRELSEPARLDLERSEARYRELNRSRVRGLWDVRVLVGAETPAATRSAAALLCSAGELDEVSYVLVPGGDPTTFIDALGKPVDRGDELRVPFTASSELLLALARPPARELPGIRLAAPPCFDVTPELPDGAGGVPLGDVLDEALRPAGPFRVPYATLNRHAFVCGATGSGKSQTMRTLLEGLARDPDGPVPWLVIEPAKAEYAGMAGRLAGVADVMVIKPSDPDVPPASLNPLEPERGFPLQSHADLVRALFLAAFEANEPFPQVLSRALTQVYTDAGWDLVTSEPRPSVKPKLFRDEPDADVARRYPTLGELQQTASSVVERIGYGKEITADVRGFVDVRMGSLREGTTGRFFEGGHPLDIGALLSGNAVLELEDITDDQDKAFLIGAVLIRIVEHLRVRKQNGAILPGLRHVTVVEEAHRLLKNVDGGPAAAAVELFASLLAEIRAYGEGVVVVEQIPAKILPDVIKNSALKVMHRLPALDDREAVGGTINLEPEQSELVVSFEPGVAAVAVDGMDRPVMVRMPLREAHEGAAQVVRDVPFAATRSPLCPPDCADRPCTLWMINDNAHRSRNALVTMWVETVVVSFLIGEPPPLPAPAVVAALGDDDRNRRCTLAQAVERSLSPRRSLLATWFDVGDFAAHVVAALDRLLGGDRSDDGDWRRWTAGFFRWGRIRTTLNRAVAAGRGGEPRHADSDTWAAMGMPLEGPTLADQLAQLKAHPSYGEGREAVVLGDPTRTGLLDALQELSGAVGSTGIVRALDLACRGHRAEKIEPRIGRQLRAAQAATVR